MAVFASIRIWKKWSDEIQAVLLYLNPRTNSIHIATVAWGAWKAEIVDVTNKIRLLLQVLTPLGLALTAIETLTPGFNIPGIRGFAHGGITQRAGAAIVGERGPELVSLPANSQISPASSVTNNFNVTATYTNPEDPNSILLDLDALAMTTRR